MPPTFDLVALRHIAVAVLAGLAIGVERQWSGKAEGPAARFAGLRTFTLLGLIAGLSGWLWTVGLTGLAGILLAGASALVVVAHLAASRKDVDGTTEVSALVVLAAGVLAGIGFEREASAITAVTFLLLVEKKQLHRLVKRLDRTEIRAAARFAVMAGVILPILPAGPFGPWGGVRPRQLWLLVLFFSGLSFIGYLARRVAGRGRGYAIAGTLGGILSSTSVTLVYSRLSRNHESQGRALAAGVMGANAALFPRVLTASLVLAPALAATIWPAFVAPFVLCLLMAWSGLRDKSTAGPKDAETNPLQFGAALQMTLLFQIVLFAVAFATERFGAQGLFGAAVFLGLTDVDALTLSVAKATTTGAVVVEAAAASLTLGIAINALVKLGLALSIGRGRFRTLAGVGLAAIAMLLGGALVMLWVL